MYEMLGVKLVVIDDIPDTADPCSLDKVKEFIEVGYNVGATVFLTTNMSSGSLIETISSHEGYFKTNTAVKIEERFRQAYQVVDFQGDSVRALKEKWHSQEREGKSIGVDTK